MLKLSGLWKNTSKDGREYWSAVLTKTTKLLIFRNENKSDNPNAPEFELYIAKRDLEQENNSVKNFQF